MELKRCPKCETTKPRAEFTVRKSGRVGHLSSWCKACNNTDFKERKLRDPTFYRRVEWPSKLKRLYGLTVADYTTMLDSQGGGCAICGSTDPAAGNRQYKNIRAAFDVDHCHTTGRVRGLLCGRCNRLVGLARDNAATASRLVTYLSAT